MNTMAVYDINLNDLLSYCSRAVFEFLGDKDRAVIDLGRDHIFAIADGNSLTGSTIE